jgi:hypothetical protein
MNDKELRGNLIEGLKDYVENHTYYFDTSISPKETLASQR